MAGRERVGRLPVPVAILIAATSVLVGCGGGSATTAGPEVRFGQGPSAQVSSGTPDGRSSEVLVNQRGYTLYVFGKDAPGSGESACYGRCERVWKPQLTIGRPTRWEEKPIALKLLGAIERRDGRLQVTYDGHPLYRYTDDVSAGAAGIGEEQFGGKWLVIHPDGKLDDS